MLNALVKVVSAVYPLAILFIPIFFVILGPVITCLAIYISIFFAIRALGIISAMLFGDQLKKGGVNKFPTIPRPPGPPNGIGIPVLKMHAEIELRK